MSVVAGVVAGGLLLTACGGGAASTASGGDVQVALTDNGCAPKPATKKAGTVTFAVSNSDAGSVTEGELLRDGKIVGEKENLTPGLSGKFTLNLRPGKYQVYCPNAKQERWEFTVTGSGGDTEPSSPELARATDDYKKWVDGQIGKFVTATEGFAAAIDSGDAAKAKRLYAPARSYYERVEPVAETFGELDRSIDGRIDDAPSPAKFTGYHRIEQLLFQKNDVTAAKPVAAKLVADVRRLKDLAAKEKFQPAQIANGATSLIDEVQRSKVTGEEERYSHTDLVDFRSNVDGAMKAVEVLTPALRRLDPGLLDTVNQRYRTVESDLRPYTRDPGYLGTGFVDYSTVGAADKRKLSQGVNALGEALSKIAAKVA